MTGGLYWDYLAMIAAIIPPTAPLALLGLGAGTVAHIVHKLYPEATMVGWELDMGVVLTAQMFLGLATLEQTGKLVGGGVGCGSGWVGAGWGCVWARVCVPAGCVYQLGVIQEQQQQQ